jgi:hypothetical protein
MNSASLRRSPRKVGSALAWPADVAKLTTVAKLVIICG